MVIRMVMIGESGTGKSTAGNSILGQNVFPVNHKGAAATRTCGAGETTRFGTKFVVVDTPGYFAGDDIDGEIKKTVKRCVELTHPGPQVFLFVFSCSSRFCENDTCVINWFKDYFGEEMYRHAVILFTNKNSKLCKGSIKKFLRSSPKELRELIELCGNRVAAIDCASPTELDVDIRNLISIVVDLVNDRNLGHLHFDSVNNNSSENGLPVNSDITNKTSIFGTVPIPDTGLLPSRSSTIQVDPKAPSDKNNVLPNGSATNMNNARDSSVSTNNSNLLSLEHSHDTEKNKLLDLNTNMETESRLKRDLPERMSSTESEKDCQLVGQRQSHTKVHFESSTSQIMSEDDSISKRCLFYDCSDELVKQQVSLLREDLAQLDKLQAKLSEESKLKSDAKEDVTWCQMADSGVSIVTQFNIFLKDIFRDDSSILYSGSHSRILSRKGAVRKSKN